MMATKPGYTKITWECLNRDGKLNWGSSATVTGQDGDSVAEALADLFAASTEEPDARALPFKFMSSLDRFEVGSRNRGNAQGFINAIVTTWEEWWKRDDNIDLWDYMALTLQDKLNKMNQLKEPTDAQ